MVSRRENFHGSRIKRAFNKGIGTKAQQSGMDVLFK